MIPATALCQWQSEGLEMLTLSLLPSILSIFVPLQEGGSEWKVMEERMWNLLTFHTYAKYVQPSKAPAKDVVIKAVENTSYFAIAPGPSSSGGSNGSSNNACFLMHGTVMHCYLRNSNLFKKDGNRDVFAHEISIRPFSWEYQRAL